MGKIFKIRLKSIYKYLNSSFNISIPIALCVIAFYTYQTGENQKDMQYGTMTHEFWSGYEKFYEQQTKVLHKLDYSNNSNDEHNISAINKEFDDLAVDLNKTQLLSNNKLFIAKYNEFALSLKIKGWDEFVKNTRNAEIEFYKMEEKAHADIQTKYLQIEHHPDMETNLKAQIKDIQTTIPQQQNSLIQKQYNQLTELLNKNFKNSGLLANGQ